MAVSGPHARNRAVSAATSTRLHVASTAPVTIAAVSQPDRRQTAPTMTAHGSIENTTACQVIAGA